MNSVECVYAQNPYNVLWARPWFESQFHCR